MRSSISLYIFAILLFLALIPATSAVNEPTGLAETDTTVSTITWEWTANDTYYNTSVWINGEFKTNVTSPITGTQTYQATGLTRSTEYSIGIRSTDMLGTYSDWVNDTATTDNMFGGISDVVVETVGLMPSIVDLVVAIVPVIITMAIVSLITGIFGAIVALIRGGF